MIDEDEKQMRTVILLKGSADDVALSESWWSRSHRYWRELDSAQKQVTKMSSFFTDLRIGSQVCVRMPCPVPSEYEIGNDWKEPVSLPLASIVRDTGSEVLNFPVSLNLV